MLTMKFCVSGVSGTIVARISKLGIQMKNDLLHRVTELWAHRFYSSLYLFIFLSFAE